MAKEQKPKSKPEKKEPVFVPVKLNMIQSRMAGASQLVAKVRAMKEEMQ